MLLEQNPSRANLIPDNPLLYGSMSFRNLTRISLQSVKISVEQFYDNRGNRDSVALMSHSAREKKS